MLQGRAARWRHAGGDTFPLGGSGHWRPRAGEDAGTLLQEACAPLLRAWREDFDAIYRRHRRPRGRHASAPAALHGGGERGQRPPAAAMWLRRTLGG